MRWSARESLSLATLCIQLQSLRDAALRSDFTHALEMGPAWAWIAGTETMHTAITTVKIDVFIFASFGQHLDAALLPCL
ncbi:hypothetical protein NBRC116601_15130 [Cognatishimia sp. WU-CL00825]|uniref:hypothetical protein n=1 Tax=Cognatishimia sp. WU-CL00825 TaxID=3127658 RepID=UPI00310287CC